MDIQYELNRVQFVWNAAKVAANPGKHEGVTFEQAAAVFFDPFLRVVDASRNDEARDAAIGYSVQGALLFVVHLELEGAALRIILARKATTEERRTYEHS